MKSAVFTAKGFSTQSLQKLYSRVQKEFGEADVLIFAVYPEYDLEEIAQEIRALFNRDDFVMFHAVEHFNDTSIIEKGMSVCCFKFEKNASVEYFYLQDVEKESVVKKTANYLNTHRDDFHMIFSSSCKGNIGTIIEDIAEKLDYSPIDNIVGGVSSGKIIDKELRAFQYIDKHLIKNGFIIVSFKNIDAVVDISLGFRAYGITYQITKAQERRLYTVDEGKSFSYIASKMLSLSDDEESDIRNLWYAPLSILSAENGYMLTLRTIQKITDDYVEFFAPLKEGDYFKLSFATPEDLIKTDKETAKRVSKKLKQPELSFNFSCIARQYVLEDMQEKELEMYVESFKTGLFGFFTFGEIGPDKQYKELKFYNETSLAVVMRER